MSETGRDTAEQCVDAPVGPLAPHKFVNFTKLNPEFSELPQEESLDDIFSYMLEVYMDD